LEPLGVEVAAKSKGEREMQTSTITGSVSVGGINFTSRVSRSAEGQVSHIVDLDAGQAGDISAAGVDELTTGHGIEAADVVDVHWVAAGVQKCRRGLLVDVANANDIEFDEVPAGEGDALPAVDTEVVVSVQVEINTDFDGDDVELIGCMSTKMGMADFRNDTPASLSAVKLVSGEAWTWASGQNIANPLTGDPVDKIIVSNGEVAAARIYVGVLYQSV
jgi:hypothetical protein